MSLSDLVAQAKEKKPLAVVAWLRELPEKEWELAWSLLQDEAEWKTYPLLDLFRRAGGRFGKDSFVPFRRDVLSGVVTKESIRVSK